MSRLLALIFKVLGVYESISAIAPGISDQVSTIKEILSTRRPITTQRRHRTTKIVSQFLE